MRPLHCKNRLGKYQCRVPSDGKVTVMTDCPSVYEFTYHTIRLPAHIFKTGVNIYQFYSQGPVIGVNIVSPTCDIQVFLEELSEVKHNHVPSTVWITTSSHHHFTLKAGSEVVLDNIPAVMLEPSRVGQYIAYFHDICHPHISVEGDSDDQIWTYSC